jgi:hypothetical protein
LAMTAIPQAGIETFSLAAAAVSTTMLPHTPIMLVSSAA